MYVCECAVGELRMTRVMLGCSCCPWFEAPQGAVAATCQLNGEGVMLVMAAAACVHVLHTCDVCNRCQTDLLSDLHKPSITQQPCIRATGAAHSVLVQVVKNVDAAGMVLGRPFIRPEPANHAWPTCAPPGTNNGGGLQGSVRLRSRMTNPPPGVASLLILQPTRKHR